MSYHGPDTGRIAAHLSQIMSYAGETGTWRQYISASTGTTSGFWGGGGTTLYYREQVVTGLWGLPQLSPMFREVQTPAGEMVAGDAVISTVAPLGLQDEIQWRGVTYRVNGDSLPTHLGGRVWYRTVLVRGDVTG